MLRIGEVADSAARCSSTATARHSATRSSSVLEVAAAELIIPWPQARVALLVVTVVGTLWILAFLAGTGMIRRIRFSADQPREAMAVLRTADQPAR